MGEYGSGQEGGCTDLRCRSIARLELDFAEAILVSQGQAVGRVGRCLHRDLHTNEILAKKGSIS